MNKHQRIKLALLVGLSAFGTDAMAQTSINAASNRAIIQGNVFDYSIGEMTLVQTERTSNLIVTQGYLQPSSQKPSASAEVNPELAQTMRVYPNPTSNLINLESFNSVKGKLILDVFDASGKIVIHRDEVSNDGHNKYVIDFSTLAAGSYFLVVKELNSTESNAVYSYKVQKTN